MSEGNIPRPFGQDDSSKYIIKVNGAAYVRYRKIGQVVTMYVQYKISVGAIAPWATYIFGTLPVGYRPVIDMVCPCVSDRSFCGCSLSVTTNGEISINGRNTGLTETNDSLQISLSYSTVE